MIEHGLWSQMNHVTNLSSPTMWLGKLLFSCLSNEAINNCLLKRWWGLNEVTYMVVLPRFVSLVSLVQTCLLNFRLISLPRCPSVLRTQHVPIWTHPFSFSSSRSNCSLPPTFLFHWRVSSFSIVHARHLEPPSSLSSSLFWKIPSVTKSC